jgi:predicted TIM-barrel fold metal-dependent hydrolase
VGARVGGTDRGIQRLSERASRGRLHRGYTGKHLPKKYIERGQIYFGFEVDEKLLPFAIEEFGDECWVYGSDIPHGDRLYGAVDVFLDRTDISEESKRKLLVDNTARFYGLTNRQQARGDSQQQE